MTATKTNKLRSLARSRTWEDRLGFAIGPGVDCQQLLNQGDVMGKFSFISCVAILIAASSGLAQAQTDVSDELISKVEMIKAEPVEARRAAARALADSLVDLPSGTINNSAVMSLAGLLTDLDDDVRFSAVEGLSFLGHEARPAAPAIERAIQDKHYLVDQPSTGPSRIGFYCKTLTIIGQWSLPQDCDYWLPH